MGSSIDIQKVAMYHMMPEVTSVCVRKVVGGLWKVVRNMWHHEGIVCTR